MVRVTTAFVCEDVRDEGKGRYIAVGLYAGDVEFQSLEDAKLDRFVVFSVIADLDVGTHTISLRAKSPNAGEISLGSGEFIIENDNTSFISIAKVKGMRFPKSGDYTIGISVDDEEISVIEFGVTIASGVNDPTSEAEV